MELDVKCHLFGNFLQDVWTLPSVPEYFGFPLRTRKGVTEDRLDARASRPDVVLFWEESRYSGKVITKDRPDKAIFRPDTPQPKSEFV
jgi:hypothetical protein